MVLQELPDEVRLVHQEDSINPPIDSKQVQTPASRPSEQPKAATSRKSNLPKSRSANTVFEGNLTSAEAQQVRTQPLTDFNEEVFSTNTAMDFLSKDDANGTLIDFIKNRKKQFNGSSDEGSTQKQQILEELHVSRYLYTLIKGVL